MLGILDGDVEPTCQIFNMNDPPILCGSHTLECTMINLQAQKLNRPPKPALVFCLNLHHGTRLHLADSEFHGVGSRKVKLGFRHTKKGLKNGVQGVASVSAFCNPGNLRQREARSFSMLLISSSFKARS